MQSPATIITKYSYAAGALAFFSSVILFKLKSFGEIPKKLKQINFHLIIFAILNFGILVQQPFIIQLYNDSGYSNYQMIILYFIPFIIKKVIKLIINNDTEIQFAKFMIAFSSVLFLSSSFIRNSKSLRIHILCAFLDGFGLYFGDLLIDDYEIGFDDFNKETNTVFIHMKSIIKIACVFIASLTGNYITKISSLGFIFYFAAGCFASALPLILLLDSNVTFMIPKRPNKKSPTVFHICYVIFTVALIALISFTPIIVNTKLQLAQFTDIFTLLVYIYYLSIPISEIFMKMLEKNNLCIGSSTIAIFLLFISSEMTRTHMQLNLVFISLLLISVSYNGFIKIVFRSKFEKLSIYLISFILVISLSLVSNEIAFYIIPLLIAIANCTLIFSYLL